MGSLAPRLIGATALVALVLGGAISVLAFLVARYGPAADGWSFKGNGAIAVYTALAPVLAAGWTALVMHARRAGNWLAVGIAAGIVGLVIAFTAAAVLPLAGRGADQVLTPILYVALLLWMPAAPALAARRDRRAVPIVGMGRHVAAGATWLVAAAAGVAVIGSILPAGT